MSHRCVAIIFLLCAAAWADPDFSALDATVELGLKRLNIPGAAVAIAWEGRIVYAKGFGVANADIGDRMKPDMLFRLGSTTKMFTAAVAASLAEEGKLDLHKPVGGYLPEVNPKLARATVHQLLTHTAGLGDMTIMDGLHDDSALAQSVRDIPEKLHFAEPGKIFSYSNPGYWVAGRVSEVTGGDSYADLLEKRILRPLGMERSTMRPTQAMTWPLAVGHGPEVAAAAKVIRPLADSSGNWPAGQLFSSAPEFARFCIAFMDGGKIEGKQVLSPAIINQLSTPAVQVPGGDRRYGYGLNIWRETGTLLLSHAGSRTGYGSLMHMYPERRFAVVILCNKTGQSLPRVAEQAAEIALGIQRPVKAQPKPLPFKPGEAAEIAGVYSSGSTRVQILLAGDGLTIMGRPVEKIGADRLQTPNGELFVVRNNQGQVQYISRSARAFKKQ